jgi:dUTP pyrophosphatase
MWVALQNEGDKDFVIEKGTAYAQGIFLNYLTCNDIVDTKRVGGLGSTNRKSGKNG